MKAVVVHPSLNKGGGAEKVCLAIIKSLVRMNYDVKLATVDKTDWRSLEARFGEITRPDEEVYVIKNITQQSIFSSAFLTVLPHTLQLFHHKIKKEVDMIVNSCGDAMDLFADISYVNAIPMRSTHYFIEPGYQSAFFIRFSARVYNFCITCGEKLFCNHHVLLTNSNFMKHILKKYLNRKALVIYPPVDIYKFKSKKNSSTRENIVVTVSRFRPGKFLECIPKIAKVVGDAKFIIAGVADNASNTVISALNSIIKGLEVEEKVHLLINPSLQRLVDIVSSAKIFLHTQPMEAFGMSIVEAMATGCVPIVPRCGGPWFDILDCKQGIYGFAYGNITEAANYIQKIFRNDELRRDIAAKARQRALDFDSSAFEMKFSKVVNSVYKSKEGK